MKCTIIFNFNLFEIQAEVPEITAENSNSIPTTTPTQAKPASTSKSIPSGPMDKCISNAQSFSGEIDVTIYFKLIRTQNCELKI